VYPAKGASAFEPEQPGRVLAQHQLDIGVGSRTLARGGKSGAETSPLGQGSIGSLTIRARPYWSHAASANGRQRFRVMT
jgi:hypothetical protein